MGIYNKVLVALDIAADMDTVMARARAVAPGAEVAVWYHPQNPSEAMLQPVSLRGHAFGFAFCVSLLVLLLWRLAG